VGAWASVTGSTQVPIRSPKSTRSRNPGWPRGTLLTGCPRRHARSTVADLTSRRGPDGAVRHPCGSLFQRSALCAGETLPSGGRVALAAPDTTVGRRPPLRQGLGPTRTGACGRDASGGRRRKARRPRVRARDVAIKSAGSYRYASALSLHVDSPCACPREQAIAASAPKTKVRLSRRLIGDQRTGDLALIRGGESSEDALDRSSLSVD
jgi:hypothetical protein